MQIPLSLYADEKQALVNHGTNILIEILNKLFSDDKEGSKSAKINHNYPVFTNSEDVKNFLSNQRNS